MFDERISLESPSGATLNLYSKRSSSREIGTVLVLHGLAEHAGRYAGFAAWLAERGFNVYAHDHRGHGSTSARDAPFRRFARKGGAEAVLRDVRAVHDHASRTHSRLPVIVFGHSMGGFLAVNYAERHGRDLAAMCAWNCDLRAGFAEQAGRAALKVEKALKGSDVASMLMRRATFDAWTKAIEPRRTELDWLSNDPAQVDAYIADPLCGFSPTVSMWEDILTLILQGGSKAGLALIPADLPCHILGGSEDPVTEGGAATEWLAAQLRFAGVREVASKVVTGARHESLNERPGLRNEALASLEAFLERAVRRR